MRAESEGGEQGLHGVVVNVAVGNWSDGERRTSRSMAPSGETGPFVSVSTTSFNFLARDSENLVSHSRRRTEERRWLIDGTVRFGFVLFAHCMLVCVLVAV